jgi:hypothetical protein
LNELYDFQGDHQSYGYDIYDHEEPSTKGNEEIGRGISSFPIWILDAIEAEVVIEALVVDSLPYGITDCGCKGKAELQKHD